MLSYYCFLSRICRPIKEGQPLYWLTSREMIFLCQITSQQTKDVYAISLTDSDMASGSLRKVSNIRPNRIFTADKRIILYKIGSITSAKLQEARDKVIELLNR